MPKPEGDYDYGAYCGLYCGGCAVLAANGREARAEGRGLWGTA